MKIKKSIIFFLLLALSISTIAFAKNVPTKDELKRKVEILLDDAWKDSKKEFSLDKKDLENKYTRLEFEQYNDFIAGNIENFSDVEVCLEIMDILRTHRMENITIGSTVPVVLVKNDASEVIFSLKEQDGTNVLATAKKENGKWVKDKKTKGGKKILDLDSINVEN